MKLLTFLVVLSLVSIVVGAKCVEWYKHRDAEISAFERAEQERQFEEVSVTSTAAGRVEAERDISAGRLRLKWYGHMVGVGPEAERIRELLQREFAIEVQIVAECEVSLEVSSQVAGYNSRMAEEFDRRFGRDRVRKRIEK